MYRTIVKLLALILLGAAGWWTGQLLIDPSGSAERPIQTAVESKVDSARLSLLLQLRRVDLPKLRLIDVWTGAEFSLGDLLEPGPHIFVVSAIDCLSCTELTKWRGGPDEELYDNVVFVKIYTGPSVYHVRHTLRNYADRSRGDLFLYDPASSIAQKAGLTSLPVMFATDHARGVVEVGFPMRSAIVAERYSSFLGKL